MPTNKNVFVVPKYGIKTNAGKNVPIILPSVEIADTLPKTVPIFFISLVINFIVNGTMAPKDSSGLPSKLKLLRMNR